MRATLSERQIEKKRVGREERERERAVERPPGLRCSLTQNLKAGRLNVAASPVRRSVTGDIGAVF